MTPENAAASEIRATGAGGAGRKGGVPRFDASRLLFAFIHGMDSLIRDRLSSVFSCRLATGVCEARTDCESVRATKIELSGSFAPCPN